MQADYYSNNPRFYVSVDCIILGYTEGQLKVLLQKRDFEPFSGEWSLQGTFVQEYEDLNAAARRVLWERTGVSDVRMFQVGTFGDVDRDPGARVISTAYMCLINSGLCDDEKVRKSYGWWVDVNDLPILHFGHDKMVEVALHRLRLSVGKEPLGVHLLPPLFTLSQFQRLHETIIGHPIDKRNFRKRIAEMNFIQKTDQIDKEHSKRGAAMYRYVDTLYNIYKEKNKVKII